MPKKPIDRGSRLLLTAALKFHSSYLGTMLHGSNEVGNSNSQTLLYQ